jgi:hypothetical protein
MICNNAEGSSGLLLHSSRIKMGSLKVVDELNKKCIYAATNLCSSLVALFDRYKRFCCNVSSFCRMITANRSGYVDAMCLAVSTSYCILGFL